MGGAAHAQTVQGALSSAGRSNDNFERDRNVSVRQRPRPGYDALGLRQGAFIIWPKVALSTEYNDNIFATDTDKVADSVSDCPRRSRSPRTGRGTRSVRTPSRPSTSTSRTRTRTRRTTRSAPMAGSTSCAPSRCPAAPTSHTPPSCGQPGSEGQPFAVQYEQASAYLAGVKTFNRLKLSARGNWSPHTTTSNATGTSRRTTVTGPVLATGARRLCVSPDTAVFVEVSGNWRRYRLSASPVENGVPILSEFREPRLRRRQCLGGRQFRPRGPGPRRDRPRLHGAELRRPGSGRLWRPRRAR